MRRATSTLLALLLVPAACTSSAPVRGDGTGTGGTSSQASRVPTARSSGRSTPAPRSSRPTPPPSHAATTAAGVLASMTEAERVGQLVMIGCPTAGLTQATASAVQAFHVGSVILDGTTNAGSAAIRSLTTALESMNPSPAKLFLATDQEGGLVQRLRGSGFDSIPSAVDQGQQAPATLRAEARAWGQQLRAAGVNVDLAPVLDTVPTGFGSNPPIGDLDREYGHDPATVAAHGVAFAQGLADAGVAATVKHFPGLGRVAGNTDLTAGVTDSVTTRHDAYLQPFAQAVRTGVPFVMVSTATYAKIDPGVPAIFSRTIITGMLREDLGFRGVVITDDIGIAAQVRAWPVGERAVRFVAAGGDMVLTVDATQAQQITAALLARAASDSAFKALVDAAALRVLQAKQREGLLA